MGGVVLAKSIGCGGELTISASVVGDLKDCRAEFIPQSQHFV